MEGEQFSTEESHAVLAARRKKLERLVDLGVDPWGQRFDDRQWIGDIRRRHREIKLMATSGGQIELPDETSSSEPDQPVDFRTWLAAQPPHEMVGPTVRAAGRVVLHRDKGKLQFIDIQDWTGQIQLFVGRDQVGAENWEIVQCIDLGDLVGVDGTLRRTKTGELSIFASRVHLLTKTLEPPPAKHVGLTDPELRQRRRYVDLAYNEGVRDRFLMRSKIVQSIRRTLHQHEFVEVEGPTLHTIAGGAAARPFLTHHNALDMELFLRIALELHLKRLMVGGIERVYELGRVYRNEGISPRHNPEFTMLEVYQAYGDYHSMMDLTEAIIGDALTAIGAGHQVAWGGQTLDFSRPFARRTYRELFREHTGVDLDAWDAVQALAERLGIPVAGRHPDVVRSDIFEAQVEDRLMGPVFVTDYPASICPLTKRKAGQPEIAERFELFVQGMELANAYTELNDPDLQSQLFQTQLAGLSEEDSMARMDHDFVFALRNGMPPAGGLGVGIDRLVMLLTGCASIRDVILFPLLRHAH
ncbi:MAG TPA: lysine--tRNA ligase [Pirellulaceae bacterium]|nr:lysine--tRNA ligase [Pirellulaceae bacterium]